MYGNPRKEIIPLDFSIFSVQSLRLHLDRARALLISILDRCSEVRLEAASVEVELEQAEMGDLGIRVPAGEDEERVFRRFDGLRSSIRVFEAEEAIFLLLIFSDCFSFRRIDALGFILGLIRKYIVDFGGKAMEVLIAIQLLLLF